MGTNDLQLHHVYTVIGPLPPPSMTVTPTTDSVAEQPVPADELEPATDD
jgi:hypothetical protein